MEKLEDGKVNKDVYDAEKANFKEDLDEAKKIALAAKTKAASPHLHCNKAEKVDTMEKTLAGWGKIRLGVVISLILVVASAVAGVVRTQSSVEAMDKTVAEIQKERAEKEKAATKETADREDRLAEQRAIVTAAVKAAFAEARTVEADIRPDRDRGRDRGRRGRTRAGSGRASGAADSP
ncbi:MAG: hypothetical protein JSW58_06300 [Candidatus Latescibacterota bacterium]|nr:MAG: hypothetical protein JSW58_06300 [Candidatus Latescibacterota bacterium]